MYIFLRIAKDSTRELRREPVLSELEDRKEVKEEGKGGKFPPTSKKLNSYKRFHVFPT